MNKRALKDGISKGIIWSSALITVGVLLWIVIYIVMNGIGEINKEFLTTAPVGAEGGIYPMIFITLYMIILTIGIATPIGICAAIYLVEYAKPGKIVRLIRFATESLAGIPSIIFGLFGFIMFVTTFKLGWSILAGALTLSLMILPTIVRTTEEALKSVPNAYRQGSLALGASKFRTILLVVLPSSIRGIMTSVILSIGRIVGETAAVFFTAGTVARTPNSVMDSGRTLAVHLYILAKEALSFSKAFATATILILLVLLINIITNSFGSKLKKD
ncbi:phosphate ABC transporter permease protein 2 [Gottschalkia acidurici 9a]|uniref:Phosphate transport system permease protein PstA n=1 Tax=Gottschalkia acidurici (strain ATCC 7906 / DSM 604 / BCRC 14475 / CIP 104303 / KCTC 5404 / NCIMB 10678 / 9a) TaxID=1128398 RepID=K0AZT6_GOTA9|nr:phosphate ABC transporter permease PstA [Gottschalkia acidurici]AFS78297.1 phosphate ABC transporter permease protein 2 [Gottschalkia acidurici 9a]